VLKYPWLKADANPEKPRKFGAYTDEAKFLEFARAGQQPRSKSLDAAIMDHADNVAHSVHDLDDFYRAGLIPLQEVWDKLEKYVDVFKAGTTIDPDLIEKHAEALVQLAAIVPTHNPYTGTYDERTEMRAATSTLIHMFVTNVSLGSPTGNAPALDIPEVITVQMKFLQHLVWRYVIENPRLATQQYGQKRIITTLFNTFLDAIETKNGKGKPLVPPAFHKQLDALNECGADELGAKQARLAVDTVGSLTDHQATTLYRRVTGVAPGQVTDLLVG
jgi:dGTPase